MTLKGIIFDFDGLIIDTEMPGCNAWAELFNQYGFSFTIEDWKKAIGTGPSAYDPGLHISELTNGRVDAVTVKEKTLIRTRQLIETQPILPGVLEFIQSASSKNIPLAVASSSNREWVEGYLSKRHIREYFSVVCTSDDVTLVKPDPALYLLAAQNLNLQPSEIIVFEDSPSGIRAAKEAGMYCIAIPNDITISMDLSLADKVVSSFTEVNINSLQDLFT